MLVEHEIIQLYKWLCFDLGACLQSCPHSCPHSHPYSHPYSHLYFHLYSHIGGIHFSYNYASDVDRIDGAHAMNDTMD